MGEIREIIRKTDNPFLNYYELHTRTKNGFDRKYFMASRARDVDGLEIRRGKTRADGVAMYVLAGPDKDRVLLIRQFRWPVGAFVYEFPAGLVEDGGDYEEAAAREVFEETGLHLTPVHADPMYTRPYYMTDGMTDEACAMVYGYAEGDIRDQHPEETEEIEVVFADREEVRRILKEERVAVNAALHLMHFINDPEPFAFLK